ncbi:hypothetical protein ACIA48_21380 [Mycobacterium sp. NPDC051804]|uniref:hypothetical protein n=1 Tax=Mycobacterium sp. NPDC051804 TaxID=3364295 RepID=UPI0037998EE4
MSTLIRAARAATISCLAVVMLVGVSPTATADPADNQANNDKLFGLLSGGYTPADCQASKQYAEDPFLARLGCGPNSREGGPTGATYSLYGSLDDLNSVFSRKLGDPIACSEGTGPGPVAWDGGMVVCSYNSRSGNALMWTKTADLLVVVASGRDTASLYDWWLSAR